MFYFLGLSVTFILIITLGLYSQTNKPFSSQWIKNRMTSLRESRTKHFFAILLRFYPFYHGQQHDVRYLTISVYRKSWKKNGRGFQLVKFKNYGSKNSGDFKRHGWFAIHLFYTAVEFHISYGHEGYLWYRSCGKNWHRQFQHLTFIQEWNHRINTRQY